MYTLPVTRLFESDEYQERLVHPDIFGDYGRQWLRWNANAWNFIPVTENGEYTYWRSSRTDIHYHIDSDMRVMQRLDILYTLNHDTPGWDKVFRVRLWYGDPGTGRLWGDIESGYIDKSTGSMPIPLIVHRLGSYGGLAISTDNILRIDRADKVNGKRQVFYNVHNIHIGEDTDIWKIDRFSDIRTQG